MKRTAVAVFLMALLSLAALSGCADDKDISSSEEPLKPSISKEELEQEVDFDQASFATAEDGEVVIKAHAAAKIREPHINTMAANAQGASFRSASELEDLWSDVSDLSSYNFTLPDAVRMADGSLGKLSIPKIGLTVSIYETDDAIEAMSNGVAHMKETSCWDGNIGLAGHNRGVNTYFGQIHTLSAGDEIQYQTALGTRTYAVTAQTTIDEMDWSPFYRTDDDRLTLLTCLDNNPAQRLVVTAVLI